MSRPITRLPGRRSVVFRLFQTRPTTSKSNYFMLQKQALSSISSPKLHVVSPSLIKTTSEREFKKTPINREEEELMMFKEVFVVPKKQMLEELKIDLHKEREKILCKNPRLREIMIDVKKPQKIIAFETPKTQENFFNKQLHCQIPGGLNASVLPPPSPRGG